MTSLRPPPSPVDFSLAGSDKLSRRSRDLCLSKKKIMEIRMPLFLAPGLPAMLHSCCLIPAFFQPHSPPLPGERTIATEAVMLSSPFGLPRYYGPPSFCPTRFPLYAPHSPPSSSSPHNFLVVVCCRFPMVFTPLLTVGPGDSFALSKTLAIISKQGAPGLRLLRPQSFFCVHDFLAGSLFSTCPLSTQANACQLTHFAFRSIPVPSLVYLIPARFLCKRKLDLTHAFLFCLSAFILRLNTASSAPLPPFPPEIARKATADRCGSPHRLLSALPCTCPGLPP